MPRLQDTGNVATPAEGMVIYNRNNKAPYFYNGKEWLSLGGRAPGAQPLAGESITYLITGTAACGPPAEKPVYAIQNGIDIAVNFTAGGGGQVSAGVPSFVDFVFLKSIDICSKNLQEAAIKGQVIASMEFKLYANGSAVPYMSYKFKNVYITSIRVNSGGEAPTESISITYTSYGFKDWTNNVEFAWNRLTNTPTTYN